ncbi:MAG: HTTM domain-containing protein [Planctomycetia bacterium]|nr:HTTM domain-containing protein [Planctomycetia bacterium]
MFVDYLRELGGAALTGWNRFWFTPADVAVVALMRICVGAMLVYTHLVWMKELETFVALDGLIPRSSVESFYGERMRWAFSYLWLCDRPATLWTAHLLGLVVLAMFTVGLFTRVTSILSFIITLSYIHRLPGVLFGLDQMNGMLITYLMLAPCGAAYSVDRLLQTRRAGEGLPPAAPSTSANIATRLIQLHMCVIYFFAGLGKLQGDSWWAGYALWGAVANLEYQTLDLTWLARWPVLTAILTQIAAYWELTFCVLIWPRILRPLTMAIALPLHLGIGIAMGLMTFGLIMPIGILAFASPALVRRLLDRGEPDDLTAPAEQGRGASDSSPERSPSERTLTTERARSSSPRPPSGKRVDKRTN